MAPIVHYDPVPRPLVQEEELAPSSHHVLQEETYYRSDGLLKSETHGMPICWQVAILAPSDHLKLHNSMHSFVCSLPLLHSEPDVHRVAGAAAARRAWSLMMLQVSGTTWL